MKALFVESDGALRLQDTPFAHMPTIRFPVRSRYEAFVVELEPPQAASFSYREYTRRGMKFDGTPIFCAGGIDVSEMYVSLKYADRSPDAEYAEGVARRACEREVLHRFPPLTEQHPRAWGLDERVTVFDESEAERSAGIKTVRVEMVVAHR